MFVCMRAHALIPCDICDGIDAGAADMHVRAVSDTHARCRLREHVRGMEPSWPQEAHEVITCIRDLIAVERARLIVFACTCMHMYTCVVTPSMYISTVTTAVECGHGGTIAMQA